MPETRVTGIDFAEEGQAALAIERVPTGVAAFIGRTLKGPVNQPVSLASFAEFQQIFGGLWQPSTLSYAVEQFFENGGRQALIVRLANGGRPPTIALPAGNRVLRLIALNPGSREYLRASVDYDGIAPSEMDRFNLVVQRVRSAASEFVEDQEIFRRLSVAQHSGRFVVDALFESRLVRVMGPVCGRRPDRSISALNGGLIGYVLSNSDGDDGGPLTDYDLIGSTIDRTGLFALDAASHFNMLCIPPLTRESDIGLSTLLVAAKFCRERQALLIVDPPATWLSAKMALDCLRTWPFRSDSAAMFFPRVQAFDRLRGRAETFASCGAAAGSIARSDETCPVWSAAESEDTILRPGLRPAVSVSDADRQRLAQAGINTLVSVRSSSKRSPSPRTLSGGCCVSDWKYLSARRLALFIAASIEQGTRWVTLEQNEPATWERARMIAEAFLDQLADQGAFVGTYPPDESHFVIADSRVNREQTIAEGKFNLLYGFATSKPGEFDTWLVTHEVGASRVRPVSVNRATTSRHRVEWEIETSILRA